MIVFRSIVEIVLIFYVLLIIGNKKYRPKWNALLIAITIFTALYILTSITGVNPYRSFWGTLERMGGAFSFVHYWIFFVILVSVFKKGEDWIKLLKLSIIAGFLSILFGYGQKFKLGDFFVGWQHESRVIGTAGNAALFAGYLIFILFLAAYLLLTEIHKGKNRNAQKVFYVLILALGAPALFLTAVRGTIFSFLGALFLLAIFWIFTSKDIRIKKGGIAFIILLMLFVGIIWISRDQDWVHKNPYLRRMTDISLKTETVQTRLWTWWSAWQGWKERPILGWGPENFNIIASKYFNPLHYQGFGSEVVWDRAHNAFLDAGATMGIIGFLSYLSIFVVLFAYFIRVFKERAANKLALSILGAIFIAYIGHNLSFFDTFNSYLMFFVVLGYVGFLRSTLKFTEEPQKVTEVPQENTERVSRIAGRGKMVAIILGIVVIFTIWKTAVIPAKANFAATRAIVYGRSDEYLSVAFDYFRKSLGYNAIQTEYEVRHHLARLVFRIFSKTDNPQELGVKKDDLIFALDEVYKNIKTDPLDPIPYLYTARLNEFISRVEQEKDVEKAGQRLEEAERLLNKAKPLNEKNPYIYFELGQVRIFQNRFEEAIEFFDQGIAIRPEVELGYWYKGITLLNMGQIKQGEEAIKQAMERNYYMNMKDVHQLLRIYLPLKNYPKIIELYLHAIKLEPTNAQLYASLATAYKENGEIDKAIEMARKVGELDPKLKPEADAWIRMLEGQYK